MILLESDKNFNEELGKENILSLKKFRNVFSCFSTRGYIFKMANENML